MFDIRKIITNQITVLLLIFFLAVIVRIGAPFAKETLYDNKPFILSGETFLKSRLSDAIVYNLTAESLIKGYGFAYNEQDLREKTGIKHNLAKLPGYVRSKANYFKHNEVPPAYPFLLASCYYLFGINIWSFYLPQILLGAFTCILIYCIAKKIFNEQIALIAGFMIALYPDLVFCTYMIRVETLFIFLLAIIFWYFLKSDLMQNVNNAFIAGILLGITCLTRLTLLFFVPIIVAWILLFKRTDMRKTVMWLLVFCFSFILTLSPWIIRNYAVFGKPTILTGEVWTIFFTNRPAAEDHKMGSYILIFLKVIYDNPYGFVLRSISRLHKYLSPFTVLMKDLAKLYKLLTWLIIFPMSFVGIFMAVKKYWIQSGLIILFIIYYILLHSLTYVDISLSYRYPIQPFLCIFAAYGYFLFLGKLRN